MTALSTHKLTHPEGEGWANQGVGERGGSPEGVEGSRLVLQKADGNSCYVPAAGQHWLLHQKPSRREMAGSVAHRYSVTGRPL